MLHGRRLRIDMDPSSSPVGRSIGTMIDRSCSSSMCDQCNPVLSSWVLLQWEHFVCARCVARRRTHQLLLDRLAAPRLRQCDEHARSLLMEIDAGRCRR